FLYRRLDVLAQQVELVTVLLLGRVDRKLRGRKREDQPTAARVHGVKPEYVSKERAVRLGIAAVDQNVRARNHRLHAASLASWLSRFLRRRPRACPRRSRRDPPRAPPSELGHRSSRRGRHWRVG